MGYALLASLFEYPKDFHEEPHEFGRTLPAEPKHKAMISLSRTGHFTLAVCFVLGMNKS